MLNVNLLTKIVSKIKLLNEDYATHITCNRVYIVSEWEEKVGRSWFVFGNFLRYCIFCSLYLLLRARGGGCWSSPLLHVVYCRCYVYRWITYSSGHLRKRSSHNLKNCLIYFFTGTKSLFRCVYFCFFFLWHFCMGGDTFYRHRCYIFYTNEKCCNHSLGIVTRQSILLTLC